MIHIPNRKGKESEFINRFLETNENKAKDEI